MKCRQLERRLTAGDLSVDLVSGLCADPEIAKHVETCAACHALVAGWQIARGQLVDQHAGIEPDAGFSARVMARLERAEDPLASLGWAARIVLPAALALTFVVVGWSAVIEPAPSLDWLLFGQLSDDQLTAFLLDSGAPSATTEVAP